VDCEKVCADADDEVNEVQEEVQEVGYLNLRAGGEWPRSMCNDEAGLEAVKRMRWPAASTLRMLAAARQVAWSCKQVTPDTAGIEAPAGWKKQELWLLLAAGVACFAIYDRSAGDVGGGAQQRGRNRNSSGGHSASGRRSRVVGRRRQRQLHEGAQCVTDRSQDRLSWDKMVVEGGGLPGEHRGRQWSEASRLAARRGYWAQQRKRQSIFAAPRLVEGQVDLGQQCECECESALGQLARAGSSNSWRTSSLAVKYPEGGHEFMYKIPCCRRDPGCRPLSWVGAAATPPSIATDPSR
jgi:hypothetical protein